MQVGNLVKHKDLPALGIGLVTKSLGVHCMVQWSSYAPGHPLTYGYPSLEVNSKLEVISASR